MGEKAGKVTHLLPNWLPYHLRERHSSKMWRGHIFRQLYDDQISVNPELSLSLEEYGWKRDTANKTLCPTSLPDNTKPAPDYILEIIKCVCKTETPCSTKKCSCRIKGLPCIMFCACFSVRCWDFSSPLWTLGICMEEEHNKQDTIPHWSL